MTKIIFLHILIGKKRKCDEREEYLFVTCQREAAAAVSGFHGRKGKCAREQARCKAGTQACVMRIEGRAYAFK